MLKCKVFCNDSGVSIVDLEKTVNAWLNKNKKVAIKQILQSATMAWNQYNDRMEGALIITIFYQEKAR